MSPSSVSSRTRSLRLLSALVIILAAGALPAWGGVPDEQGVAACGLLDDARVRGLMSSAFEMKLLLQCGRGDELGQVPSWPEGEAAASPAAGTDALVNDRTGETGTATTQSETSLAISGTTGTLCSGFNDAYSGVTQGLGYTGFSRSTDGGLTWTDGGALPSGGGGLAFGDPAMIWRKSDGKFYLGSLHSSGLGLWRSDDDCATFVWLGMIHTGGGDDKELLAVDNKPASAYYGRIYCAWTDFNVGGGQIFDTFSTDGGATWSGPVAISTLNDDVQGAWPAVDPTTGEVVVTWVRWNPYSTGPIDAQVVRSTDGGATFAFVTAPMSGKVNPRDNTATGTCGRPALNGNIRYLPSPQIAVGPDGTLHVVYTYDPDGFNTGDVVNAYYRKSTDDGATWGTEVQLNDDATTTDQFFPSLSVGTSNVVSAAWYDRRNDAGNTLFRYYHRFSYDGGATWQASTQLSDGDSPIYIDPNLNTCYHGDYDTQVQSAAYAHMIWSDDRNTVSGHQDPDIWHDRQAISTDYFLTGAPGGQSVCAPADAVYTVDVLQFQGFVEPVTLATNGTEPAGTTVGFSTNPVTPPGSSTMTIGNTGSATAGSYTTTVTGTSSPSGIIHTTDFGLDLFDAIPGTPTLTAPANGATNVSVTPTYSWSASSQAASYEIDVATDAGFTNIIDSAAALPTPSYASGVTLNTSTQYFWRARARNACGIGTNSSTFSFTTEAAPGDCGIGQTPNSEFVEDFESGAAGWTSSGTGNSWAQSSARVHAGAFSWHADDPVVVTDQRLVSPAVALPASASPLSLKFWQHQTIEDSSSGCYDGAILEISTDGGSTWTQLNAQIVVDPYDGVVSSCCSNPLATLNAWCGDPQDWTAAIADLDAYAGMSVQLRFRLGTDSSVSREGWYIDDVSVQSCSSLIFADGFESGDTSAWSSAVP